MAKHGFEGSRLGYLLNGTGFFHQAHRAVDDCHALLEILALELPAAGARALGILLEQARKKKMRVWAEQSPFELKDALKRRGYRWSDGSDDFTVWTPLHPRRLGSLSSRGTGSGGRCPHPSRRRRSEPDRPRQPRQSEALRSRRCTSAMPSPSCLNGISGCVQPRRGADILAHYRPIRPAQAASTGGARRAWDRMRAIRSDCMSTFHLNSKLRSWCGSMTKT